MSQWQCISSFVFYIFLLYFRFLSKLYDVRICFITPPPPPPLLRRCIAFFAVAEERLLLDIGWFVLFLSFAAHKLNPLTRLSNVHVFPELLDDVADKISLEYLQLGLELGFSLKQIQQLRIDYKTSTLGLIREMLRQWVTKNHPEDRDTIGWLATALLNARCDISCLYEWEDVILEQRRAELMTQSTGRRKCVILW